MKFYCVDNIQSEAEDNFKKTIKNCKPSCVADKAAFLWIPVLGESFYIFTLTYLAF